MCGQWCERIVSSFGIAKWWGRREEHSYSCGGKLVKVLIVKSGAGVQSTVKRQMHGKCLQHESSMHPEEPLRIGEGCQSLSGIS